MITHGQQKAKKGVLPLIVIISLEMNATQSEGFLLTFPFNVYAP